MRRDLKDWEEQRTGKGEGKGTGPGFSNSVGFIWSIIPGTRKESMNMESKFCSVIKREPLGVRIRHT